MRGRAAEPILWLTGLFILSVLAVLDLTSGSVKVGWSDLVAFVGRPTTLAQVILETVRFPRLVAAVLVGAALAMAGTVMQTTLRNPLAAPDIVAVTSGAQFALVLATLVLPFYVPPLAATIVGGALGALICITVAGGIRTTPIHLALAGVAVSLCFTALSSAIILVEDDRASGMVLWSAGLLDQTGWLKIATASPAIIGAAAALALMTRTLDLFALGDNAAKSLGLTRGVTVGGIAASIVLSAAAVTLAGPIGFVGLAVPNLLRTFGVVRHVRLLPLAGLWGANAVLSADVIVQLLSRSGSIIPTGAAIACMAAPAMFFALRFAATRQDGVARTAASSWRLSAFQLAALLIGLSVLTLPAALIFGGDATPSLQDALANLDIRLPRMIIALGAGALLAAAGVVLQAASRNPLCGPETLGISQGAGLFSLVALLAGLEPGSLGFQLSAISGAFTALAAILFFGTRPSPQRLILAGVAVAATFSAASTFIVVSARLQTAQALSWMAGSTHGRGNADVLAMLPWLACLCMIAWMARRHLDTLCLGDDTSHSLGMPTSTARMIAATLACFCTAIAVSAIGPVAFIGLLAPHAARFLAGARHGRLLPVSMTLGAFLLAAADVVGRTILAPNEIPAGIVTALLGAPLFVLVWRRRLAG
ncbi:iron ABC transporter permease [Rhizobium sp. 2MFCol3.1]|uniref:iron ABC transporter permease n=1 Tax=Rhizobium sp. 2MFCol3.1 TaxID=1246459 RepID=UPI0003778F1D|nr:iron ABC transporter permease [Rhizobium sp. 2MFCol3.1]